MFKNPKEYESILIKSLTVMDHTNYDISKEDKNGIFDIIFNYLERSNSNQSQIVEVTKYICKYVFKSNNDSKIISNYGKIMIRKAKKFELSELINMSKLILTFSSTAAEANKQLIFHIFVRLTQNYKFDDEELNFIFFNFLCDFIKRNEKNISNEEVVFLKMHDYEKIFSIHDVEKLQNKEADVKHLYLAINFSELLNIWEKLLKQVGNRKKTNKNNLTLLVYCKYIFEGCKQQSYLIDKTEEFFIDLLKEKNWILAANASNIFYYFKKSEKITKVLDEFVSYQQLQLSEQINNKEGDEKIFDQLNFTKYFAEKKHVSNFDEFFELISKNSNSIETKELGKIINISKNCFSLQKHIEIQKIIFQEVLIFNYSYKWLVHLTILTIFLNENYEKYCFKLFFCRLLKELIYQIKAYFLQ